jgi:hypothetical protein
MLAKLVVGGTGSIKTTVTTSYLTTSSLLLSSSKKLSTIFAQAEELRPEKCCRLCHSNCDLKDMISPCDCNGTMKFVHQYCLDQMREHGDTYKCPICERHYNFVLKWKTLNMLLLLIDWFSFISTCFVYPYGFYHGNWRLALLACSITMVQEMMELEFTLHPEFLTVTNKLSFFDEFSEIAKPAVALLEFLLLFLWYCSTLTWTIDGSRLFPAMASFIICEIIVGVIGALVGFVLGSCDKILEDDNFLYFFVVGIVLWSVVRAEVVPSAGQELVNVAHPFFGFGMTGSSSTADAASTTPLPQAQ